jgi:hypothetical protein
LSYPKYGGITRASNDLVKMLDQKFFIPASLKEEIGRYRNPAHSSPSIFLA